MSLLDANHVYKPFRYPWAYDAWLLQQRVHWLPEEVPLADDVKDWHNKLTPGERHTLTQIFRFFTQADIEVNNCYMKHYARIFQPTEVQMTLAVFGAFTEGLQLFASFAILLNFPRFNKMKGMGQIVSWSVRDESLHTQSIVRLFRTFISENPELWTEDFERELYKACETIVTHEDAFIDLAFELGEVEGIEAPEVKRYIRYIADRRLTQLGLQPIYRTDNNPLPGLDAILNGVEHANFFENRATEYSRAATRGTWEEAFE